MYFAYGFPKAYNLAAGDDPLHSTIVHLSCGGSQETLVVVTASAIQLWSGGHQRIKLGELRRSTESLEQEGVAIKASWCPARRVVAVATDKGYVLFFGVASSKEAIATVLNGEDVRRVSIYLQNSVSIAGFLPRSSPENDAEHADGGNAVVDLCGDGRSVLAVLRNGAMLALSWSAELRCRATPLSSSSERNPRRLSSALSRRFSNASDTSTEHYKPSASFTTTTTAAAFPPPLQGPSGTAASAAAPNGGVGVTRIRSASYASKPRRLAIALENGCVAVLALPDGGLAAIDHARPPKLVYRPLGVEPECGCDAMSVAMHPEGDYVAVGLTQGKVAIVRLMTSFLSASSSLSRAPSLAAAAMSTGSLSMQQRQRSSLSVRRAESSNAAGGGGGGGGGTSGGEYNRADSRSRSTGTVEVPRQLFATASTSSTFAEASFSSPALPPARYLSLSEWGHTASSLGAVTLLQWSPDGKVVAVGYENRGMAVWTASGCRVMCSLRQATAAMVDMGADSSMEGFTIRGSGESPEASDLGGTRSGCAASGFPSADECQSRQRYSSEIPESQTSLESSPRNGILEGPLRAFTWSLHGYSLILAEDDDPSKHLLEIFFARAATPQHRVAERRRAIGDSTTASSSSSMSHLTAPAASSTDAGFSGRSEGADDSDEFFLLQAADRLLVISETLPAATIAAVQAGLLGSTEAEVTLNQQPDLSVQHLRLPQAYLDSAYPLMHCSASPDGSNIAVAGTQGLALYHTRQRRWRLFGDAMQERQVKVHALTWLPRGIVVAVANVDEGSRRGVKSASSGTGAVGGVPTLLLYPKHHLDSGSVLARKSLPQLPVCLDATGRFLALAFAPLDITLMRAEYGSGGESTTSMAPDTVVLTTVRQLSMLSLAGPPLELTLLPPPARRKTQGGHDGEQQQQGQGAAAAGEVVVVKGGGDSSGAQREATAKSGTAHVSDTSGPEHCVILRSGGVLSVLDLLQGTEVALAEEIEAYWLPATPGTAPKLSRNDGDSKGAASLRRPASGAMDGGGFGGGGCGAVTMPRNSSSGSALPRSSISTIHEAAALPIAHGNTKGNLDGDAAPVGSNIRPTRDDSAASMASEPSPAAKGAAWLERRVSEGAAAMAAMAEIAETLMELQEAEGAGLEKPWWTYGPRGMQLWFPSTMTSDSLLHNEFNGPSYSYTNNINVNNKNNNDDAVLAATSSTSSSFAADASFPLSSAFSPNGHSLSTTALAAAAAAPGTSNATDPELEFDKEVYPLGVSLAEVSIVGVTQRSVRSAAFPSTSPPAVAFHPHPERQPVLPCLLRRLLDQGQAADALELATRHSKGPHFARSLEWLLFTALEANSDHKRRLKRLHGGGGGGSSRESGGIKGGRKTQSDAFLEGHRPHASSRHGDTPDGGQKGAASHQQSSDSTPFPVTFGSATAGPLLIAAARLIQHFPLAAEIIVSVARKTDAALWPALFAAAGSPAELCEGLLQNGALQTAACCLLIVERVEGALIAQALALRLIRASLAASEYSLAADLLRFLVPPGEGDLSQGIVPPSPLDAAAVDGQKRKYAQGQGSRPSTPENRPQTQLQQQPQQQPGVLSSIWSFFTGEDVAARPSSSTSRTPSSTVVAEAHHSNRQNNNTNHHNETNGRLNAGIGTPTNSNAPAITAALHRAVSAASLGRHAASSRATSAADDATSASSSSPSSTAAAMPSEPAVAAWRAMGRHSWKLFDSGALRKLAALGHAMESLHGGLPALLATTAADAPAAVGHATPSAAAIASALFVAINEFAAACEGEASVEDAASELQKALAAAGCVNHAMALALMLGESQEVNGFAAAYPDVWPTLLELVSNDVHLCIYTGLLSPPGTPLMQKVD